MAKESFFQSVLDSRRRGGESDFFGKPKDSVKGTPTKKDLTVPAEESIGDKLEVNRKSVSNLETVAETLRTLKFAELEQFVEGLTIVGARLDALFVHYPKNEEVQKLRARCLAVRGKLDLYCLKNLAVARQEDKSAAKEIEAIKNELVELKKELGIQPKP